MAHMLNTTLLIFLCTTCVLLSSLLFIYVAKQVCRLFHGSSARRARRNSITILPLNASTSNFGSTENIVSTLEGIPEVVELPLSPLPPQATASPNRERTDDIHLQYPADTYPRNPSRH